MGCNLSSPNNGQAHVFKAKNLNENDKSIRSVYIVGKFMKQEYLYVPC